MEMEMPKEKERNTNDELVTVFFCESSIVVLAEVDERLGWLRHQRSPDFATVATRWTVSFQSQTDPADG